MTKLALVGVAMFAFGFALVPLYNLACKITGINGKTQRADARAAAASRIDRNRMLVIEFTGLATTGLPWEFRPVQRKIKVHPGEVAEIRYYVRNTTDERITGQAVPSVAPSEAAPHFKKIECFCFSQQTLGPHEAKEMPVKFFVDSGVAKDVNTITLSYTFFNTSKSSARKYAAKAGYASHERHNPRAIEAAGG